MVSNAGDRPAQTGTHAATDRPGRSQRDTAPTTTSPNVPFHCAVVITSPG
jgi:hypothetical protein